MLPNIAKFKNLYYQINIFIKTNHLQAKKNILKSNSFISLGGLA